MTAAHPGITHGVEASAATGLRRRLIPVVLLREGVAVQSKGFRRYQRLGDPGTIVQRLSEWASDELIYLDITRAPAGGGVYDAGRDDLGTGNARSIAEALATIARRCFMPLAFGGGIRTLDDCARRIAAGADKVVINTQALREPGFIDACAREFGSQCVVLCIDAKSDGAGGWSVFGEGGRFDARRSPAAWAREAQERGAGEVLIQSIDRDGRGDGYDLPLVRSVVDAVSVPVIALGGVGEWSHLADGLTIGGADAVAAANIFNYTENSVHHAKRVLFEAGLNVRRPRLDAEVGRCMQGS